MKHKSLPTKLCGVFLLLAAVACSKKEEAKPAPLPPPPAPLSHRDDETPPPPEPEVEAPKTEPVSNGKAAAASTGCEPKVCNGKETEDLTVALGGRARQARVCYEMALRNDPSLQGKAAFKVRIAPSGQVCAANVAKDDLHNAAVISCSLKRLGSAAYPKPKGGCVDVTVPIDFKPR